MMTTMIENKQKEVEGLKAKRNSMFAQLVKKPQDTHLALEIKLIDDQIAESVRQRGRPHLYRSTR